MLREWIISSAWLLLSVVYPQAQGWRGIVPLHSTRGDVEHILGLSSDSNKVIAYYYLESETVTIQYTTGGCEEGSEWNVPPETVLTIAIHPKTKPKLSELHIDLTKFKKESNPHIAGIVYYVNKEDGIGIESRADEELAYSISYTVPAKDDHLRCSKSRTNRIKLQRRNCSKFYP
jgi:hypothetical protein